MVCCGVYALCDVVCGAVCGVVWCCVVLRCICGLYMLYSACMVVSNVT